MVLEDIACQITIRSILEVSNVRPQEEKYIRAINKWEGHFSQFGTETGSWLPFTP